MIDDSIYKSNQLLSDTKKLVEKLKWQNASRDILPLAKFRLEELRHHNSNLENGETPEILESSAMNIISNLQWFIGQEEEYPGAPWLIGGGACTMMISTRNRYNQMLFRLAKDSFDDYSIKIKQLISNDIRTEHTSYILSFIDDLRGFIDTKAENQEQCFKELDELHYKIEELYG